MALIADNAGIFTGAVLDYFNQAEAVVARDGDLASAQEAMRQACLKIANSKTIPAGGPNGTYTTKRS